MNYLKKLLLIILFVPFVIIASCDNSVQPEVFTELAPDNLLSTKDGIRQVLNSAYAASNWHGWDSHSILNTEEMTTDILWDTGGGENRTLVQLINFTWSSDTGWFNSLLWERQYRAIRNANTVIDNIDLSPVSDEEKSFYLAEARFLRALSYYRLYTWFGPVPLRTSTEGDLEIPRATEEEMLTFIESELQAVINDLPEVDEVEQYGRANKSAARGYLALFYLNTKEWQKAANMAQTIIDSDHFQLVDDYLSMFRKSGEMNSEFIWANYGTVPGESTSWISGAFPPGFKEDPTTGISWNTGMRNWATQYRIYDSFYDSFDENDVRRNLIMDEYINLDGDTVSLRDNDNYRALKYYDANAIAQYHDSDIPTVRYAEILLTRAEALNELNGPNQESIDLINQIRERANLTDIQLSDFSSKEELRNHILDERGWEFYCERKRRLDLIRMDKYIEQARNRGATTAQDFHRRYPIPQAAMDANSLLEQNPGY